MKTEREEIGCPSPGSLVTPRYATRLGVKRSLKGNGWAAWRGALSGHARQGHGTHFLRTHLIHPATCLTSCWDVSGISNLRRSRKNTQCSAPSTHQPVPHPRSRLANGSTSYSSQKVSSSLGSSPPSTLRIQATASATMSLFKVLHAPPSSLHLPGHHSSPCHHLLFLPNRRKQTGTFLNFHPDQVHSPVSSPSAVS